MDPLVFKIGSGESANYYTIPASSFLFKDEDVGKEVCHLAIVTQKFTHMDYWILGGAFMNNFYVVYDADNVHPRVGMAVSVGSDASIYGYMHNPYLFGLSIGAFLMMFGVYFLVGE